MINLTSSDYEQIVKLSDEFNGVDLRNVCTEAGKFKICCIDFVCSVCVCMCAGCFVTLFSFVVSSS